ncbi:SigB/SigF/SigG family RNA polymerase sigma factor [Streptacidiphilus neutrinimicus]|uniref:SigB/SigF/SigG family RNA polymerase sigma factor n=1 Tax=Streptacidiphilus neutrinimicus TaxID=105420 RepID=UPI0005AB0244|nr:SigB/SigF/SigG family RNA polymerase sigma factor [Streptacidiphilus neutrinimicus]
MPVEATRRTRPDARETLEDRITTSQRPTPKEPSSPTVGEVREMTDLLFVRLRSLEEGTSEYSYVRNTLVELNMALVRHAAARFAHRSESLDDIVQVGVIGLIKAINRFEPERGLEFVTYALPTITGEIKRHFRDTSWAVHVPRRLQELRIELARAGEALHSELGREPTTAELADRMGVTPADVVQAQIAANAYTAGTLETPGTDEDDHSLHERLGEVEPALETIENVLSLKEAVNSLSERERTILRLRFVEELTQAQIGKQIGVSQMQVSRLLTGILATLRHALTTA